MYPHTGDLGRWLADNKHPEFLPDATTSRSRSGSFRASSWARSKLVSHNTPASAMPSSCRS